MSHKEEAHGSRLAHGSWLMASSAPIIGLAGGIGSGKTEVARILAELGCVVADSDALGREVLDEDEVREQLVGWWGGGILDDAGRIDRSAVARIAFGDPDERRRLERLTHPRIESGRKAIFDSAPADAPALVIDAPLLLEAGLETECDAVIFIDASRETRAGRVARTRGWDEGELRRREDSQLPLDVKRARADYVVENDGGLSGLTDRVRRVLRDIVESCRN